MARQVTQMADPRSSMGRHLLGFSVLVLDINGLKRINDAFGHASGDRMLMGVAAAVRATVRTIDTPVRMGGDEFCVLAPQQTGSGAKIHKWAYSFPGEHVNGIESWLYPIQPPH